MGRAPCCDKANVKRGPWSPEEDETLKTYVETHGTGGNWIALPRKAGLRRCGKSCRLRWLNYLRPDIKRGCFTEEEDTIICTIYSQMGSRWSAIASQLPGRTDNDVKNYWNTKLKRKLMAEKVSLKTASETAAFPSTSTLTQNSETHNSNFPPSQSHSRSPSPLSAITDANSWFNNNAHSVITLDPTQLYGQEFLTFSEICASSVNNQQGSSISDSSSIAVENNNKSVLSLPEHEEVLMDFGFGFSPDLVNDSLYSNEEIKVGEFEFAPSCYPELFVDNFIYADIKPQGLNQNLI